MTQPEINFKANSIDEIHYKVMALIKDYPIGKVLDFPSGFGRLSYWLREKGHEVTSCDIAIEEYSESPIKHKLANLNDYFPFDDNKFDYAFCVDGPEHAENLYHTFREFYRVLKPKGLFVVSIPNYSNIESRLKQFWYGVLEPITTKEDFSTSQYGTGHFHINRPTFALLRMSLEAAKFSIIRILYDKEKNNQKYFYPFYLMIRLVTKIKGEKGDKKYWLKSANSRNVLMGGNTLILICKKEAA